MLDSNGANTTAAAAVLSAAKHCPLKGAEAVVLAATGPVGSRSCDCWRMEGARSRQSPRAISIRAEGVCQAVAAQGFPRATHGGRDQLHRAAGCRRWPRRPIVIAAGAAGRRAALGGGPGGEQKSQGRDRSERRAAAGIGRHRSHRQRRRRDGVICYGAIGVGGTKMKIHKAAIRPAFRGQRPGARRRGDLSHRPSGLRAVAAHDQRTAAKTRAQSRTSNPWTFWWWRRIPTMPNWAWAGPFCNSRPTAIASACSI